jgi:hypothetical protein
VRKILFFLLILFAFSARAEAPSGFILQDKGVVYKREVITIRLLENSFDRCYATEKLGWDSAPPALSCVKKGTN